LTTALGLALEVDLGSATPTPRAQDVVRVGWEPDESFLLPMEG
jgi:hypothetical protein